MSNEKPMLVECPIKSFKSDGDEGVTVTLQIPEHVADAVAQTKADGAAALVETYGPDALAKAREEGRRQGWEEATARVERRLTEVQENGVSCDERIDALRSEIEAVEGSRRSIAQKANALRAALAELNADAPKEPA